jgi:hypothetical protein
MNISAIRENTEALLAAREKVCPFLLNRMQEKTITIDI